MVATWVKMMVVVVVMRRRWLVVEILRRAIIECNRMEHVVVSGLGLGIRHDMISGRLTVSMNEPLRLLWRVRVGEIGHRLTILHILLRVHALLRRVAATQFDSRMRKELGRAFVIAHRTNVYGLLQPLTDQIHLIWKKLLLCQIVKVGLTRLIGSGGGGELAHVRRLLTVVSLHVLIVVGRGGHKHIVHLVDVVVFVLVVLLGLDAWVVRDVNLGVVGVEGVLNAWCMRRLARAAWLLPLLLYGIEHLARLIVGYLVRMVELVFGASHML